MGCAIVRSDTGGAFPVIPRNTLGFGSPDRSALAPIVLLSRLDKSHSRDTYESDTFGRNIYASGGASIGSCEGLVGVDKTPIRPAQDLM